jgi:RNA polymerase sigma-70 factor (ECF subfamily)
MAKPNPEAGREIETIRRCQNGDREAFTWLVETYRQPIFSLVFHLLHRRDEVEDIVQEIFIKAFVAIRSYNFRSSFRTWLSRIAINHCYDYLRRNRVSRVTYFWQMDEDGERRIQGEAEDPNPDALNQEEQLALADLVDKLLARAPAEDRVILALKELEGRSIEEIAEVTGLKPSTVKVRLHRARKRMLKDFRKWRSGRISHALPRDKESV